MWKDQILFCPTKYTTWINMYVIFMILIIICKEWRNVVFLKNAMYSCHLLTMVDTYHKNLFKDHMISDALLILFTGKKEKNSIHPGLCAGFESNNMLVWCYAHLGKITQTVQSVHSEILKKSAILGTMGSRIVFACQEI